MTFRVRIWGARGSLPVSMTTAEVRDKLIRALVRSTGHDVATPERAAAFIDRELAFDERGAYGGNTSCVEVETGHPDHLICDLGSGARALGVAMMKRFGPTRPQTYNILMSHLHWDHIMGFPFFAPAYIPGNRIRIHGCHAEMEEAFRRQHGAPSFPVEFDALGATVEFVRLLPGATTEISGVRVTPKKQEHIGDSYGYRLEKDGKSVIYATDSEHRLDDEMAIIEVVDFFRDADLVIFDAMYSFADALTLKQDWGHSSNVVGVELCRLAGAHRLCLFHHEPASDDAQLEALLAETVRLEEITREGAGNRPLMVSAAYDGLVIDI